MSPTNQNEHVFSSLSLGTWSSAGPLSLPPHEQGERHRTAVGLYLIREDEQWPHEVGALSSSH
jgi:hypothetical protein